MPISTQEFSTELEKILLSQGVYTSVSASFDALVELMNTVDLNINEDLPSELLQGVAKVIKAVCDSKPDIWFKIYDTLLLQQSYDSSLYRKFEALDAEFIVHLAKVLPPSELANFITAVSLPANRRDVNDRRINIIFDEYLYVTSQSEEKLDIFLKSPDIKSVINTLSIDDKLALLEMQMCVDCPAAITLFDMSNISNKKHIIRLLEVAFSSGCDFSSEMCNHLINHCKTQGVKFFISDMQNLCNNYCSLISQYPPINFTDVPLVAIATAIMNENDVWNERDINSIITILGKCEGGDDIILTLFDKVGIAKISEVLCYCAIVSGNGIDFAEKYYYLKIANPLHHRQLTQLDCFLWAMFWIDVLLKHSSKKQDRAIAAVQQLEIINAQYELTNLLCNRGLLPGQFPEYTSIHLLIDFILYCHFKIDTQLKSAYPILNVSDENYQKSLQSMSASEKHEIVQYVFLSVNEVDDVESVELTLSLTKYKITRADHLIYQSAGSKALFNLDKLFKYLKHNYNNYFVNYDKIFKDINIEDVTFLEVDSSLFKLIRWFLLGIAMCEDSQKPRLQNKISMLLFSDPSGFNEKVFNNMFVIFDNVSHSVTKCDYISQTELTALQIFNDAIIQVVAANISKLSKPNRIMFYSFLLKSDSKLHSLDQFIKHLEIKHHFAFFEIFSYTFCNRDIDYSLAVKFLANVISSENLEPKTVLQATGMLFFLMAINCNRELSLEDDVRRNSEEMATLNNSLLSLYYDNGRSIDVLIDLDETNVHKIINILLFGLKIKYFDLKNINEFLNTIIYKIVAKIANDRAKIKWIMDKLDECVHDMTDAYPFIPHRGINEVAQGFVSLCFELNHLAKYENSESADYTAIIDALKEYLILSDSESADTQIKRNLRGMIINVALSYCSNAQIEMIFDMLSLSGTEIRKIINYIDFYTLGYEQDNVQREGLLHWCCQYMPALLNFTADELEHVFMLDHYNHSKFGEAKRLICANLFLPLNIMRLDSVVLPHDVADIRIYARFIHIKKLLYMRVLETDSPELSVTNTNSADLAIEDILKRISNIYSYALKKLYPGSELMYFRNAEYMQDDFGAAMVNDQIRQLYTMDRNATFSLSRRLPALDESLARLRKIVLEHIEKVSSSPQDDHLLQFINDNKEALLSGIEVEGEQEIFGSNESPFPAWRFMKSLQILFREQNVSATLSTLWTIKHLGLKLNNFANILAGLTKLLCFAMDDIHTLHDIPGLQTQDARLMKIADWQTAIIEMLSLARRAYNTEPTQQDQPSCVHGRIGWFLLAFKGHPILGFDQHGIVKEKTQAVLEKIFMNRMQSIINSEQSIDAKKIEMSNTYLAFAMFNEKNLQSLLINENLRFSKTLSNDELYKLVRNCICMLPRELEIDVLRLVRETCGQSAITLSAADEYYVYLSYLCTSFNASSSERLHEVYKMAVQSFEKSEAMLLEKLQNSLANAKLHYTQRPAMARFSQDLRAYVESYVNKFHDSGINKEELADSICVALKQDFENEILRDSMTVFTIRAQITAMIEPAQVEPHEPEPPQKRRRLRR